MSTLKKVITVLRSPNRTRRLILAVNKSPLRHVMKAGATCLHPGLKRQRISGVKGLQLTTNEAHSADELRQRGYTMLQGVLDPALLTQIRADLEAKMSRNGQTQTDRKGDRKSFWVRLSDDELTGSGLDSDHPLVRLALEDSVLKIVSGYFGEAPFLGYVLTTLSVPSDEPLKISQLWHLDRDDTRVVKLFVYFSDVLKTESGPFTFLDKVESDKVSCGFLMEHMPDSKVFKQARESAKIEMKGPAFTAFLCDTNVCFHMGSRVAPGHHRLMFTALYTTLPSNYPWGGTNKISVKNPDALNGLQRLALKAGS